MRPFCAHAAGAPAGDDRPEVAAKRTPLVERLANPQADAMYLYVVPVGHSKGSYYALTEAAFADHTEAIGEAVGSGAVYWGDLGRDRPSPAGDPTQLDRLLAALRRRQTAPDSGPPAPPPA